MIKLFFHLFFFCFLATSAYADEEYFDFAEFDGDIFILDTLLNEIGKQNLVLSLSKGTAIPLKISVTGPIFKLDGASNLALRLSRTLYLKFSNNEVFFSVDKKNWGEFNNFLESEFKMQIERDSKKMPIIKVTADMRLKE